MQSGWKRERGKIPLWERARARISRSAFDWPLSADKPRFPLPFKPCPPPLLWSPPSPIRSYRYNNVPVPRSLHPGGQQIAGILSRPPYGVGHPHYHCRPSQQNLTAYEQVSPLSSYRLLALSSARCLAYLYNVQLSLRAKSWATPPTCFNQTSSDPSCSHVFSRHKESDVQQGPSSCGRFQLIPAKTESPRYYPPLSPQFSSTVILYIVRRVPKFQSTEAEQRRFGNPEGWRKLC